MGPGANFRLGPADTGVWLARLAIPAAVIFPALIIGWRYATGFGTPDSFSQTFDNIYHLNAVRYIADTHNGSTLTLGSLTDASRGLYPAAMHDSMALVLMLGAPSVMAVVNVGSIVIGALVWPLACIFLISRIVGYRPIPLLTAGVLSAGFSAFPYLMVSVGVLYPNHAALAILPAVLGLGIEVLGMSRTPPTAVWPPVLGPGRNGSRAGSVPPERLCGPVGLPGSGGCRWPDQGRLATRAGTASKAHSWRWSAFTLAYLVITLAVWKYIRPDQGTAGWTPFETNARSLGGILGSAPMGTTTAWVMLLLTIIGLYVVARQLRRYWWVAGMYAVGGVLYLVVSSWHDGSFRNFLTGVWYTDSFRLAALLPVVTLPVVVLGAEWLVWRLRWITGAVLARAKSAPGQGPARWLPWWASSPPRPAWRSAPALCWFSVLPPRAGPCPASRLTSRASSRHCLPPACCPRTRWRCWARWRTWFPSPTLSVTTPAPARPWCTPLRTGRRWHPTSSASGRRRSSSCSTTGTKQPTILQSARPSRSCMRTRALDFGGTEITPRADPLVGVRDLADDSAPGVQLVKAVGDARLFRITACG